jgi:type I restriction enzyme, S subunit
MPNQPSNTCYHWESFKLLDICEVYQPKTISKKQLIPDGEYNVYGANGIIGRFDKYNHENSEVLITCRGATCGKVNVSKPKSWINGNAMVVTPKTNSLIKSFISYYFQSINLSKIITGSAQPQITRTSLDILTIPLPLLPEQHRIVAKIEELFSEMDNAVENLRKAKARLKTYRQAVLDKLLNGKKTVSIEKILIGIDQGWSPKCENFPSNNSKEWGVIKTSAIQNGKFIEIENKKLPPNLEPRIQHELKSGDILITRAGPRSRVGICCMVKKTRPRLLNCDKVYRLKVNEEIINPEYFELILNSPRYQRIIEKHKTGISDSGVNLTQGGFKKLKITIHEL